MILATSHAGFFGIAAFLGINAIVGFVVGVFRARYPAMRIDPRFEIARRLRFGLLAGAFVFLVIALV